MRSSQLSRIIKWSANRISDINQKLNYLVWEVRRLFLNILCVFRVRICIACKESTMFIISIRLNIINWWRVQLNVTSMKPIILNYVTDSIQIGWLELFNIWTFHTTTLKICEVHKLDVFMMLLTERWTRKQTV